MDATVVLTTGAAVGAEVLHPVLVLRASLKL